jgi:hypothetical protein
MRYTQTYWVFELCPSSGIQKLENTTFRKLDLFPSSGGGGETPTLLGTVTEVSSLGCVGMCLPSKEVFWLHSLVL